MTPLQKLLNALAVLARAKDVESVAAYLELASVTVGATADDKPQVEALTAEILDKAKTKTPLTDADRLAVRDRRRELAAQIAALPRVGG